MQVSLIDYFYQAHWQTLNDNMQMEVPPPPTQCMTETEVILITFFLRQKEIRASTLNNRHDCSAFSPITNPAYSIQNWGNWEMWKKCNFRHKTRESQFRKKHTSKTHSCNESIVVLWADGRWHKQGANQNAPFFPHVLQHPAWVLFLLLNPFD